jgi:two-component system, OmpR family, response regulator ArlR
MKILIVEDEEKIASFIKSVLENEGNQATTCESVEEVLKHGYESNHDLLILDLMLPGKRGEYLLREMRKKKINIPVIVLSALNRIGNKIELFNLGADDYMTKPFDALELIARVNAQYRRYLQMERKEQIKAGPITFHRRQNKIIREGKEIQLTKKEGELFEFLLQNRDKTIRTEDIIRKIWGSKITYHSNVVQATIRRLRRKVDEHFKKKLIKSCHGIGYVLSLD